MIKRISKFLSDRISLGQIYEFPIKRKDGVTISYANLVFVNMPSGLTRLMFADSEMRIISDRSDKYVPDHGKELYKLKPGVVAQQFLIQKSTLKNKKSTGRFLFLTEFIYPRPMYGKYVVFMTETNISSGRQKAAKYTEQINDMFKPNWFIRICRKLADKCGISYTKFIG